MISLQLVIGVGDTIYGLGVGTWPWTFRLISYEVAGGGRAAIQWLGPLRLSINKPPKNEIVSRRG